MKQNRLDSLENQHDKLYDAWEKVNQTDLQNSIQLSQNYQHMTDGAIRRVYIQWCMHLILKIVNYFFFLSLQNDTVRKRVADTAL